MNPLSIYPGLHAFLAITLAIFSTQAALANGDYVRVTVVDPFVELHSGAGRGYPVLEVVEQGTSVEVLAHRTTWYLLRTARGSTGWASRSQMLRTLVPGGENFQEDDATLSDYREHRWEVGTWAGDFEGNSMMGFYGAWRFIPVASTELSVQQAVGRVADSLVVDASLIARPFPSWSWSPYTGMGTGIVQTRPATILVGANSREDQSLSVATGIEHWVSQAFVLRVEFRNYRLLTSRQQHESIDTWKAGLAVFF